MTDPKSPRNWNTLDRDLSRIARVESATMYAAKPLINVGLALVFVAVATVSAAILTGGSPGGLIIVVAAAFGAYLALNIGANDVANNMGPAVGANALSMTGALIIAAVCETAGALLAGADVVSTISTGIVAPESLANETVFVLAMLSALLAAAIWINLATWLGAPVSTTHSVVGGVVGVGIAAAGLTAVEWPAMGRIAASWVISPLLGGVIAAAILAFLKWKIIYREDKIAAARIWVPLLIGIMCWAFGAYMVFKGLKQVLHASLGTSLLIGAVVGLIGYALAIPLIRRQSQGLENRKKSLKVLFQLPLILSAALMSFAHGANDVANAVGPLAAIVNVYSQGGVDGGVSIPTWVMFIGAFGLSVGLLLFGPKLIRMVGNQITKLNPMRAYCVALSAAVTVIAASWLGLPVSSTHIAIGGVFGVGFFREWYEQQRMRKMAEARPPEMIVASEERQRRKLVRRSHFLTIVAAWVITVPATAILSGLTFFAVHHFLG